MLSERTGTREIRQFSGLWAPVPLYGTILAFTAFASLGLPALAHFAAEVQIVLAALGAYPWAAAAMLLGVLITTAMFLWTLQRVLMGALPRRWTLLPGLNARELAELLPLVVLTCLGMVGLAASQDLVLIALFIQLITVGSYTLVGIAKQSRRATEGALELFLFSAASSAVMLYGTSLLYGLTGSLRLPEIAARLPAVSAITSIAVLGLVVVGYGFKITLVPFQQWAPDTYQGAPTPISGFLAVGPKAAGLAVLLRTLAVAY